LVDAGALRVTRAYLGGNPPDPMRLATAQQEISRLVAVFEPPRPDAALAVGGTARAIARIIGRSLDVKRLESLMDELAGVPAETVAEPHGITPERTHTLLGGTLVLAATARRLRTDLEAGWGGLREGAALALARAAAAAA
jgi:exopolyphosphatase/pppGpp-phosphohydrolase